MKLNHLKNEKGSVMVIVALMFTALMGFGALTIDIGRVTIEKSKLQNAIDATVLAAAQELPNETKALSTAEQYIVSNGYTLSDITVTFPSTNKIKILGSKDVEYTLAKVIGIESKTVNVSAAASITPAGGATGIVPLGIESDTFVYGQVYTLKEGGGSGYCGNYGALALGGHGADKYRNNLKNGYNALLKVGDWVSTEPGNMKGPTEQGLQYRIDSDPSATYLTVKPGSKRIVIAPIIHSFAVNGRSDVLIDGFAVFFIKSVDDKGIVTGNFMQMTSVNATQGTGQDFGLHSMRLSE